MHAITEVFPRSPSYRVRATPPGLLTASILLALAIWPRLSGAATAQHSGDTPSLEQLREEIEVVRRTQATQIDAVERETANRIRALEREIDRLKEQLANNTSASVTSVQAVSRTETTAGTALADGLAVSGDFRLRFEDTSAHAEFPARDRGVMRARLSARYAISDGLTLGARLVTGDPDDPNSSDVTVGSFVDDLSVSLDQAYAEFRYADFFATGGKFGNPFVRTDLVWDGDVNPAGVAASWQFPGTDGSVRVRLTGIHFVIDEQTSLADSYMDGAQLTVGTRLNEDWMVSLSGGYYDYSIGSLVSAGPGDTRDNNLTPDGSAYLSNFELVDTILDVSFSGLGEHWPVRLTGDYVHNLRARVPEDTGYGLDVSIGRASTVGDWKLTYGYALNETDAVLTAFSHDNTTYGSNYRQHALSIDYVPFDHGLLNLTGYYYRRDTFMPGYPDDWDDYITRIRLNLSFMF